MKHIRVLIVFLAVLMVAGLATAAAQTGGTETETELSGVVVGVDAEAGTVDILQADGTIVTVTLSEGDYHHPITALLAEYFGTDNLADWEAGLEALQTDGGVVVALVEGADGTTWTATVMAEDGTTTEVEITDATEAAALQDALDATTVDLTVLDDGAGTLTLPDISDQIEAYHDAGIGYGELVKIYEIAAESQAACEAQAAADEAAGTPTPEPGGGEAEEPCGVTVEELAAMVLAGTDMGTLFETYGKPALLGVGHVRKALEAGGTTGGETGEGAKVTICHKGSTTAVPESAVSGHLGHGDTLGACP